VRQAKLGPRKRGQARNKKRSSGIPQAGQAVPAPYPSHAPGRNGRELAPPVPHLGVFSWQFLMTARRHPETKKISHKGTKTLRDFIIIKPFFPLCLRVLVANFIAGQKQTLIRLLKCKTISYKMTLC
jgi:hypothetical protein